MMDKKSKVLITFFIISIFVSVFFTYKRSFVDQDFLIVSEEEPVEEIAGEESEEE